MNAVVELPKTGIVQHTGRTAVQEVLQHAVIVQEVMQAVMKEGVHYGRIPGTDKPTLLKAGAEKLCMVFHIGDEYRIEDLSTPDFVRYRITCIGRHQQTQTVLGEGVGECSGGEEKYKWRKAVCKEEFEITPQHLRRIKFGKKSGGGHYTQEQVRTEPADLANTVLKMASKRAKMAMVLNVTAASDCFSQDLEDLDETLRAHLVEEEAEALLHATRAEWVAKAQAAANEVALRAVMKEGVKVFQQSKDGEGYRQFAAAVQARGAVLKPAPKEGSGDVA